MDPDDPSIVRPDPDGRPVSHRAAWRVALVTLALIAVVTLIAIGVIRLAGI
jgi:hypothetical protein